MKNNAFRLLLAGLTFFAVFTVAMTNTTSVYAQSGSVEYRADDEYPELNAIVVHYTNPSYYATIIVADAEGNEVHNGTYFSMVGENSTPVYTSDLPGSGTYTVTVYTGFSASGTPLFSGSVTVP